MNTADAKQAETLAIKKFSELSPVDKSEFEKIRQTRSRGETYLWLRQRGIRDAGEADLAARFIMFLEDMQ